MKKLFVLTYLLFMWVFSICTSAELVRGIAIDFIKIGNAGNDADSTGYGAVCDEYLIGKYEVTNAQWNAFVAIAGAPAGNPSNAYDSNPTFIEDLQPINQVSWLESLQFCNYLTSGDKSKGVYWFSGDNTNPGDFLGINRDAAKATYGRIYFLPTEDEWYKAAYYKPDGSGYSLYANGTDIAPIQDLESNYYNVVDDNHGYYSNPWNVGTGTKEQNGTYDMMGNVWERTETSIYEDRWVRRGGGFWSWDIGGSLSSLGRNSVTSEGEYLDEGFRIASNIPEPASLLLFGVGAVILRKKRLPQD